MPVVLNDGLGCDGFIWRYLWEPLTAQRRVLHWNYRGHGRSGVPTDDSRIGMEYITDDLARLMDAQKLESAVMFGHSMGVQVCLEFHRRHRARVKGLVLICAAPTAPRSTPGTITPCCGWPSPTCSARSRRLRTSPGQ